MKRTLMVIIGFILLTLYPVAELTRYIVVYQNLYGSLPLGGTTFPYGFTCEVVFIWVTYLLSIMIVATLIWQKSGIKKGETQ